MSGEKREMPVTFGCGCAVSDSIAYIAAFLDEIPAEVQHTRLFALNLDLPDRWFHHDLPDETVVSVCFKPEQPGKPRAVLALCEGGNVEEASSLGQSIESIGGAGLHFNSRGLGSMSAIRFIGDRLYACGAGNQVYRRDKKIWTAIDNEIAQLANEKLDELVSRVHSEATTPRNVSELIRSAREFTVLRDIAGLREDEIYVCGTNGVIWVWSGKQWRAVPSGTRQHLHSIHCVSDEDVLIAGGNSTLLQGNARVGFRRVRIPSVETNFWSIRKFEEVVYLGGTDGLYKLTKDGIELLRPDIPGLPSRFSVQSIDLGPHSLWVVTDRFVMRLLDGVWEHINHPDNQQLNSTGD